MRLRLTCVFCACVGVSAWLSFNNVARSEEPAQPNQLSPEAVEFFEKRVRPILSEHCYQCHSSGAGNVKGGLLLDSRDGVRHGGDSGPVFVEGKPDESLLIEAINYASYEMPPDGKLPQEAIDDLTKWIAMGAPDPRTEPTAAVRKVLYSEEEAKSHWAYQPLTSPKVPKLKNDWVRTPVDAFILEKLREAKLKPSPATDRRSLLRRITYDLTGLPPTQAEVDAFIETSSDDDTASEALNRVIDRLLDSPRYGERWGRHWLDVARYADNSGERSAGTKPSPLYPFAWTYRDWVIDAMNRDLPFDEFIIQQIAGDRIATDTDRRPLAALGFLTVGKRFGQNMNDRIDDRIDVISKGFLGLTMSCARCHDHKFDPIPTADYYSLHGILASSEERDPILVDTTGTPEHDAYLAEQRRIREEALNDTIAGYNTVLSGFLHQSRAYLLHAQQFRNYEFGNMRLELVARNLDLNATFFQYWVDALDRAATSNDPVFVPWLRLAALNKDAFAHSAPRLVETMNAEDSGVVNAAIVHRLASSRLQTLSDIAQAYQSVFEDVERALNGQFPMAHILAQLEKAPTKLKPSDTRKLTKPPAIDDPTLEAIRVAVFDLDTPLGMQPRDLLRLGGGDVKARQRLKMNSLVELDGTHPGAPVRAQALLDAAEPHDSHIYVRGEKSSLGPEVPRRFLEVLSPSEREAFRDGSGRLELARAIADPESPLVARVIVNRVWQWHFGHGLVRTPSDFGLRGEAPSHPELLDWLAGWFIDQGWSLKKLHRLILTSSVYQQSSATEHGVEQDPSNTLLWRANVRRLEFEEIRDSLLFAAGRLDFTMHGRAYAVADDVPRRTIYQYVNRLELPAVYQTFDFASPDMTTAERATTTVPQQALYTMNSPWFMDQSRALSAASAMRNRSDRERVEWLYRQLFQRFPDDEELSIAIAYVTKAASAKATSTGALDDVVDRWDCLAQILLASNEFFYVE